MSLRSFKIILRFFHPCEANPNEYRPTKSPTRSSSFALGSKAAEVFSRNLRKDWTDEPFFFTLIPYLAQTSQGLKFVHTIQ